MVFAYHKDVVASLKASFPGSVTCTGDESGPQKHAAVQKFRTDPDCRVFIGNIKAAGQGIDGLQDVCDLCVFAEMTYTPGEIDQAIDRLVRIGQDKPVNAYFIVAKGSHDEDMVGVIERKRKIVERLIDSDEVEKTKEQVKGEFLVESIFDV